MVRIVVMVVAFRRPWSSVKTTAESTQTLSYHRRVLGREKTVSRDTEKSITGFDFTGPAVS